MAAAITTTTAATFTERRVRELPAPRGRGMESSRARVVAGVSSPEPGPPGSSRGSAAATALAASRRRSTRRSARLRRAWSSTVDPDPSARTSSGSSSARSGSCQRGRPAPLTSASAPGQAVPALRDGGGRVELRHVLDRRLRRLGRDPLDLVGQLGRLLDGGRRLRRTCPLTTLARAAALGPGQLVLVAAQGLVGPACSRAARGSWAARLARPGPSRGSPAGSRRVALQGRARPCDASPLPVDILRVHDPPDARGRGRPNEGDVTESPPDAALVHVPVRLRCLRSARRRRADAAPGHPRRPA